MPRVSCLTVTLGTPDRLPMLVRAIDCYAAQTHADRDLVIVSDASGEDAARLAALVRERSTAPGLDGLQLVLRDRAATLGALRNVSVAAAPGEIVCQWDDDDLHHPARIEAQLAGMTAAGADAVVLADVMSLEPAWSILRWTNWAATPAGAHPGTLMARRAAMPLYPEAGAEAALGEDLAVLRRLDSAARVHRLAAAPWLYVYVAHGANSWPAAHHAMLADTLAISAGLLRRREAALRAGLAPLALGDGIAVAGSNDLAFLL